MPHSVSIWSSSPTTTCSCASAQHRRHTSRKYDSRVGSAGIFGVRLRIDGCHVGSTISASSCRYSCRRSPGRVPTISILMSSSGR